MFYRLYSLKIPSAALIGGHAPAGGTLLTNCCDYRVMVNNPKYTIGLNEVKIIETILSFHQLILVLK
jgi:3,2-trans-enoyl-CoA isomerase